MGFRIGPDSVAASQVAGVAHAAATTPVQAARWDLNKARRGLEDALKQFERAASAWRTQPAAVMLQEVEAAGRLVAAAEAKLDATRQRLADQEALVARDPALDVRMGGDPAGDHQSTPSRTPRVAGGELVLVPVRHYPPYRGDQTGGV